MAQSLHDQFSHRVDVPIVIVASTGALIAGLALPFMQIDKFVFFKDAYSLPGSILSMLEHGNYWLAIIIFFFSIVFPFGKLAALMALWFMSFSDERRMRLVYLLAVLGKWSMLDVFVVAVLLVLTNSKGLVSAEPRAGIYVFAGAILLSMVASLMVEHLAKKTND